jgi:hypothetical protein
MLFGGAHYKLCIEGAWGERRVGQRSRRRGEVAQARQDYLINRNRMIYEGSSQVNVGTLLASTVNIPDSRFPSPFKSSLFKRWSPPSGRTVLDFLFS